MKIRYKAEHEDGSAVIKCLTKCPHLKGHYVGSAVCRLCQHFGDDGWPEENIVTCNYKEEEVKNEAVSIDQLKKDLQEMLDKSKILIERIDGMTPDPANGDDWEPKTPKNFTFLNAYGEFMGDPWLDTKGDRLLLKFHNVYPSLESAQSALPDITRCNAIIRACRLVEPDFVPDWEGNRNKYYPCFNQGRWEPWYDTCLKTAPSYVSTIENCEIVCALLTKWEVK